MPVTRRRRLIDFYSSSGGEANRPLVPRAVPRAVSGRRGYRHGRWRRNAAFLERLLQDTLTQREQECPQPLHSTQINLYHRYIDPLYILALFIYRTLTRTVFRSIFWC